MFTNLSVFLAFIIITVHAAAAQSLTLLVGNTTDPSITTAALTTPDHRTTEDHNFSSSGVSTTAPPDVMTTTPAVSNKTITSNCSSVPLSLPPGPVQTIPSSDNDGYVLKVDFGDTTPGHVHCVWSIDTFDNKTSNTFSFLYPQSDAVAAWCSDQANTLVTYDVDPKTGNESYIDDVCRYYNSSSNVGPLSDIPISTGRIGFRTVVRFQASGLAVKSLPILQYASFAWPNGLCENGLGNDTSLKIAATEQRMIIQYPASFHRFPNQGVCSWTISSAETKNVVHLRITSQGHVRSSGVPSSGVSVSSVSDDQLQSIFYILFSGFPSVDHTEKIPLNDAGLDYYTKSLDSIIMAFEASAVGGAPPFNITVWTDTYDQLCPLSTSPTSLTATAEIQAFKGVNHAVGKPVVKDRECGWNITAPTEGMVVQLTSIYNMDYLIYAQSYDHLMLNGEKIEMTENYAFPYWSTDRNLMVGFHSSARTTRSQFIITYRAVPSAQCQGHPLTLTVSKNVSTVLGTPLGANDTVNGTDCRWLLKSTSGRPFRAAVRVLNQTIDCDNSSFVWGRTFTFSAYYSTTRDSASVLYPDCRRGDDTWVLTSEKKSDVMLIVFNRAPSISYVTTGLVINFMEDPDPKPTGAAGQVRCAAIASVLAFVSTLYFALH